MPKPRVVQAGVPSRMPEVIVGFSGSNGNAVLVAGDVGAAERQFRHLAGELLRPQIDQHQMRVGAAGDDVEAVRLQMLGQRLGVLHHVARIGAERGPQRLAEGHRLGGDHMHQRAALHAGEHRRVELLGDLLVVRQDHAAARAAQRLVRRGGHHMRVREWRGMRAAGNEPGEMRHVDEQVGADLVADFAEALEVDDARIGRAAGDDELRLVLARKLCDLVHVDALVLAPHAVRHRLEPFARHVDRRAVGEMAAGGEIEPHEGVAGLQEREEHFRVGGGAGMRLHIGELAAEQFGDALDREALGDVDELAAAVIALARQPLGIFVGQHRALRLQHRTRDDVLRRDQLDLVALAAKLKPDRLGDLRVGLAQGRGEQRLPSSLADLGLDVADIHALLHALLAPQRPAAPHKKQSPGLLRK